MEIWSFYHSDACGWNPRRQHGLIDGDVRRVKEGSCKARIQLRPQEGLLSKVDRGWLLRKREKKGKKKKKSGSTATWQAQRDRESKLERGEI